MNLFVAKYVGGVSSASITFMIEGTGAPAFAVARRSASCVASTSELGTPPSAIRHLRPMSYDHELSARCTARCRRVCACHPASSAAIARSRAPRCASVWSSTCWSSSIRVCSSASSAVRRAYCAG